MDSHSVLFAGPGDEDSAHDRLAHRRTDPVWLREVMSDPATKVVVLAGSRVQTEAGAVRWYEGPTAPPGDLVLLGEKGGAVRAAVLLRAEDARESEWAGLRQLFSVAPSDELVWLAHAVGIAEWRRLTTYCPRCGGSLDLKKAGHVLGCQRCGREQFPRVDPAVIMLVVAGERCLLGRNPAWPAGRFSTLAGFVEPGETLEDAVRREVLEEVGVRIGRVEYFGSQPWPLPQSLMLGFVAYAESEEIITDEEEIAEARWFTRAEMREQVTRGEILLPGGVSISRHLVEYWYGEPLPGHW